MDIEIIEVKRSDTECIIFKVLKDCNLWPYILMDTTYDEGGNATNVNRHVYIFENYNVVAGDYVILYTHKGTTEHFKNRSGSKTHTYYWGFEEGTHIWNNEGDKTLLVKVSEYKFTRL